MNKYFFLLSFFAAVSSIEAMQEARATRSLMQEKNKAKNSAYQNELQRKESDKIMFERLNKKRKEVDARILARTKLSK